MTTYFHVFTSCAFFITCEFTKKLRMNFSKQRAKLPEKPDLILIITDQERATQNFPAGWEKEHLKTMTFLKDNGFTFNKAFCNSCMCSPSRTTLFTGVYPSQHGVTQTLTFGGRYSDAETQLDHQQPHPPQHRN